MTDKYYVYRPVLDLIGLSEGTDWNPKRGKGRGYNETLAYGAYTGGNVTLVTMTLKQVDELQTKMLQHPANKWNSSAIGRYQIVRTTKRSIEKTLGLDKSLLFNEDMQDRMACYLLGVRGIDKWLAGRMSLETLVNNLAKEWASFPNWQGKGHYSGQNASVSVAQVVTALNEVRKRHLEGQPKQTEVIVEVPEEAEVEVKKETRKFGLWTTLVGLLSGAGAYLADRDIEWVVAAGGVSLVGLVILTFLGPRLAKSLRLIREELS